MCIRRKFSSLDAVGEQFRSKGTWRVDWTPFGNYERELRGMEQVVTWVVMEANAPALQSNKTINHES